MKNIDTASVKSKHLRYYMCLMEKLELD